MPAIYDLTVAPLARALSVLTTYLDKAQADAEARGIKPEVILATRLYPDMLPFSSQIQRVSDTAKGSIARLTGIEAPSFPDTETTFDQLKERVANTQAFVESVTPDQFAGADEREIVLRFGKLSTTLSGAEYVSQFMLPNLYFHVTVAHAILRHCGVAVGKLDYLGAQG